MKKQVKFSDNLDLRIISNREQIKEKERLYKYNLYMYVVFIIGSILFFFYKNYPVSFILLGLAFLVYILSNYNNLFHLLGYGVEIGLDPYALSIFPQEIMDLIG